MRRVTPQQLQRYRDLTLPHYVYRCFDADGDLIYIGCTSEVSRRMSSHRRGDKAASRWLAVFMVRHEVSEPYAGRLAGQAAEAEAIALEQPVFNHQHRTVGRGATSEIATYLVERGYVDLAVETACTCWRDDREAGTAAPWCVAHIAAGLPLSSADVAS